MDRSKHDSSVLCVLICEKTESISIPFVATSLSLSPDSIFTTNVPRYPAFNKNHFLQGRALWPITYHPQTPPEPLTEDEKIRYRIIMQRAIDLGRVAGESGNAPVGMVIIDSEGNIVGESGDRRHSMFLDHCCFAGIRDRSNHLLKKGVGKRPSKEDPYLCTNCDVIMTREPCIMYSIFNTLALGVVCVFCIVEYVV